MKRNSFVYIFKTTQITIMSVIALTVFLRTEMPMGTVADGGKFFAALFFSLIDVMFNGMAELAMTVFRLPVFYKQRDFLFYLHGLLAYPFGSSGSLYHSWNQEYGSFLPTAQLDLLHLLAGE